MHTFEWIYISSSSKVGGTGETNLGQEYEKSCSISLWEAITTKIKIILNIKKKLWA
jgi:hypothetical protein